MLVSVIMSVYNTKEQWLRQSVESILNQTFNDFEFIIILDCPTDNSAEIVEEYRKKDSRIKVLVNENNIGLTKSLNRGFDVAKGKYIARMDADDISVSNRFEMQVRYLEEHQNAVAVGSRCYTTNINTPIMHEWVSDRELLRIRLLFRNVGLPHPSAMIRRSTLQEHGIRYTEWAKKAQDYKLWVDLIPFGELFVLPDILLIYREHASQISANGGSKSYSHRIAIEQAENLIGNLSEKEKLFHSTATEVHLPEDDVVGYAGYLNKLSEVNKEKNVYNQKLLALELEYIWIKKTFYRFKIEHRFDMLLYHKTFCIFRPSLIRFIWKNKRLKKDYIEAIDNYRKIKLFDV